EVAARKIFWRGIFDPEWVWLSFTGTIEEGAWCGGLPIYSVVLGDVFLPWTYTNAGILRREDQNKFRYWIKVPRVRVNDVDSRRIWTADIEKMLSVRLPQAGWK